MYTTKQTSMLVSNTDSYTTKLNVEQVTGDFIVTSYMTMPRNRPNTYKNYATVWQKSSDVIPWDEAPKETETATSDQETGNIIFDKFTVTGNSYVMGYAVGDLLTGSDQQRYGNICATAYIPAGATSATSTFQPSLTLGDVLPNLVTFTYTLPDGITPKTNGAWVGVWRAETASYTNPPQVAMLISKNVSSASQVFNMDVGIGETYTLGLYMSGYSSTTPTQSDLTTLACSLTFQANK